MERLTWPSDCARSAEDFFGQKRQKSLKATSGARGSKLLKARPRSGRSRQRRNVNWQMAIKKKCHMAALHALHTHLYDDVPELRKKIVHLALFQ